MCPTRVNGLSLLWKSSNHKFKRCNFPVQCKGSHIPRLSNYHVGSWTNIFLLSIIIIYYNFYYRISCSWIRKSCMFCMSPNILSVFHIQSYNLHCYSSERWITYLTLLPQVSIELILVSSGVFLNGVHIALHTMPTGAWSMRMGTSLHKSRSRVCLHFCIKVYITMWYDMQWNGTFGKCNCWLFQMMAFRLCEL